MTGCFSESSALPPPAPLTVARVADRVEGIRAHAADDEFAHSEEDALYQDVLRAIADGAPHAQEMAAVALVARTIKFDRWCA